MKKYNLHKTNNNIQSGKVYSTTTRLGSSYYNDVRVADIALRKAKDTIKKRNERFLHNIVSK